jgi:hypothetical protein
LATLTPSLLIGGTNVLAVELHQASRNSTDISFALELSGSQGLTVTRGPYLQMGTPTSVVVRWRTDAPSNSRVRYGTDPANLTDFADHTTVTTEHEVTVSGLTPNTPYYYAIGTTTQPLAGGDTNHVFRTAPATGTAQPTHIWVIGDAGTADANARAVHDAYLSFTGTRHTNIWLMLGDNAYVDGTDSEYQAAVFDMYPTLLRQTVLWPTLGNHDGQSADSTAQSGPYYDIFTLPTQGEAGGLASGTEAYYSFDYGNIHFIVLDSFDTDRSPNGAMLTWLQNDLAATTQQWIIAYWHHPPYSKGSHDSDTEAELRDMRENALPILEAGGVDLVLSGHSHSYERSFLINGHYGLSSTFTASMQINGGDGRSDGDGAYQKPALQPTPHAGTVYTVAGASGKISGGPLNHPAMFVSFNTLGSIVLDVDGDRLDALYLDNTGAVLDYCSLVKAATPLPTVHIAATGATVAEAGPATNAFTVSRTDNPAASLTVHYTVSGAATPSSDYTALPGSVTIPSGATTAAIILTPLNDTLVEENEPVVVTLQEHPAYLGWLK